MLIDIDDKLLAKVNELRGNKSLDEVIEEGLRVLIKLEQQREIFNLRGKIQFDDEAYS